MSNLILTVDQTSAIRDFVWMELRKRGIFVSFNTFNEIKDRNGNSSIEIKSSEFQTQPVLFKRMAITSSASFVSTREEDTRSVWINVGVKCEKFSNEEIFVPLFEIGLDFKSYGPTTYNVSIS